MEQVEQLEQHFNAIPLTVAAAEASTNCSDGDADSDAETDRTATIESIVENIKSSPPLAQRVKVRKLLRASKASKRVSAFVTVPFH